MWLDLRHAGELPATNLCWNYTVLTISDSPLKAGGRARYGARLRRIWQVLTLLGGPVRCRKPWTAPPPENPSTDQD